MNFQFPYTEFNGQRTSMMMSNSRKDHFSPDWITPKWGAVSMMGMSRISHIHYPGWIELRPVWENILRSYWTFSASKKSSVRKTMPEANWDFDE